MFSTRAGTCVVWYCVCVCMWEREGEREKMIYLYNKLTYLYYTLYYIIDIYRVLLKYFDRKKIIYIGQAQEKNMYTKFA